MKSTEHAKILKVEDEGIIADNLAFRLSTAGYDVTGIAESTADAMERIRERAPELILMDIHIKGSMDGIETTAALRELSDIPAIYLTAYSDQKTKHRANVTGASGFLCQADSIFRARKCDRNGGTRTIATFTSAAGGLENE
jgi:CheY-like chemotaxis protein